MMIKMKRRKPVLDINGESDYQRRRWPNERIPRNGSPSNPLVGLVGQYNSDSENEDEMRPANKLNDKVNDFFKEIQSIAPDKVENQNNTNSTMNLPSSLWQECYDESTGYPYYWHIKTNEVTWEMPAELKALLNKDKKDSTPPVPSHGSKIPQWSSEMVKKFSDNENNIPDGMIPKEVVARNRNRQAGIFHNTPKKPTEKSSKKQGFKRESSDDEKIEMITSFGNEESESEESEDDKSNTKTSKKMTGSQNMKIQQKDTSNYNKKSEIIDKTMGPDLPQTIYGPANNRKLSEALSQSLKVIPEEKNISNTENDILNRLKNQAKALQNIQKNTELTTSNLFNDKQKDLKLSLVPGYEDDSDGDDSQIHKQNSKPLFPISGSKFQANVLNKELLEDNRPVKQLELSTGNIRIYDYRSESENKDSNNEENPNSQSNESSIIDKNESGNDQEKKINKFLDDIDAPSKAFQRKKRIAFDVAPNKSKTQESQENLNTKEEYALNEYTESVDNTNRQGLGFPREEKKMDKKSKPERNVESLNKKAGISFVKGETVNSKNEDQNKKLTETIEKEKCEFKTGMDSILEKLRFLSEGSPTISAVQIMGIQLQTLICAWESKDLEETYLRNWVENTSCELSRLEKTAAPPGWECQWDRAHKRYYYRNTATGEAQWTYPQSDIAGGTEEMDLCTTPPPEQEEPPIIEMNVLNSNMNNTEKVGKNKNNIDPEIKTQPPPPPMISSPSPPPPPKIFAEDLKQQSLKRKAESPEKSLDVVKEKISKDSIDKCHQKVLKPEHCETISQNVETTELSYALSGHPLEALYAGHQQSNPIYAATLGATGIPILPHHPSLVPGQIMHYPTYHQHLHNQALVARLSSQEAMQFMVAAEYARVYENNQVIAKPPVKVPQESSLGSAINSFYSDIAVIEKNSETEKEKVDARAVDASTSSNQITSPVEGVDSIGTDSTLKEKKKKKLKTGLGKKQKEMSSMVAKWQKAQKNYAED